MEDLATLPFIGGHVTLDFVNTAEGRGHPQAGDALSGPDDLWFWGVRRGLLSAATASAHGEQEADRLEFDRAIRARELLHAVLVARVSGLPAALEQLGRLVAEAYAAGQVVQAEDGRVGWLWSPAELASVRHIAVVRAADLLDHPDDGRLKQCPGEHCGWFFLDRTKRGNRRWCSMAECGQEAKDERRRARRASAR